MGRARAGESARSKDKQPASSSRPPPPRSPSPPRPRVFFRRWSDNDKFYLKKMQDVQILGTKLGHPPFCRLLQFDETLDTLFRNMGLGHIWRLAEPTYPKLVREFLASATVSYTHEANPLASEGALSFFINRTYHEIPLNDLCRIFGFSAGERTTLPWYPVLDDFWRVIAMYVDRSRNHKEALVRNPVLRYAARLVGTLMFGTTTAASLSHAELTLLFLGVRHLFPEFDHVPLPPVQEFNMGAVLAHNLAYFRVLTVGGPTRKCGFGAVITRLLKYLHINLTEELPLLDRYNKPELDYFGLQTLLAKEFLCGPLSSIPRTGPWVYRYQDRDRVFRHIQLPQPALTDLTNRANVEFLPPPPMQCDPPAGFKSRYAARIAAPPQAAPPPDAPSSPAPFPDFWLPDDTSQYVLPQAPPPSASTQQHMLYLGESVRRNNDMLHKMWRALATIGRCVRPPSGCSSRAATDAAAPGPSHTAPTAPAGDADFDDFMREDPAEDLAADTGSPASPRYSREKRARTSDDAGGSGYARYD